MAAESGPLGKKDHHATSKSSEPPISLVSTVELAWGLTLNFSSDEKENKVGAEFLTGFMDLKTRYKDDPRAAAYLDGLSSILSGYLRTSGFERDTFISCLDVYKKSRDSRLKNIDDLANLASVSPGSFLARMAGFLGIGSLSAVIGTVTSVAKPTSGLPFNLAAFLLFGFGGVLLVTFVVRALESTFIESAMRNCEEGQLAFWRTVARPQFKRELKHLANQVQYLQASLAYTSIEVVDVEKLAHDLLPSENLYQSIVCKPR